MGLFKNTLACNIPGAEPVRLKAWYDPMPWDYVNCEPETKKWFCDNVKPSWHIFDCGAHIGYYSVLFSRLAPAGKIYAFEPTETIEMLKTNLSFNKIQNVYPFKLALGNKNGFQTDGIFRVWGNEPEKKEYEFTTTDRFIEINKIEKIDCIKIDVDSFDFEVLQGAEKTMEKFNPFIVVELNHALNRRNQSNMQALEWMMNRGYENAVCIGYDNFVFKKNLSFEHSTKSIKIHFA